MRLLERFSDRARIKQAAEEAKRFLVPLVPIEIISRIVPSRVVLREDTENLSRFWHGIAYVGSLCDIRVEWFERQDVDRRSDNDPILHRMNEGMGATRFGLQIVPERGATHDELRQNLQRMAAYMTQPNVRDQTFEIIRQARGKSDFPKTVFDKFYDKVHSTVQSSVDSIR